jgi:alanyl-tRNA synthetase
MQPMMPYFLGQEQPPSQLLTTPQKCFRTQDRVWASVHAGDPQLKLGADEEAIELWQRVGMPIERIVPLPTSENFWSVGGPGPCGPDSELYYDWGEEHSCGQPDCAPGCNRCPRFLEFWNLVFMSYEQHADGTLTPLPKQNIDTGLGLERSAAILQDVMTVYDTDGYRQIMDWIAAESGVAYGDSPAATKAHRILADHGRSMTFLVADGVTPSNEGRGYVLRRIIRRAVQQAQRIGLADTWRLPAVVVEQMGDAHPELRREAEKIEREVRAEEERFSETLARGLERFEELAGSDAISAENAFTLAATYGFPIELTVELAEERGQQVDVDGYRQLMDEHREISRGSAVEAVRAIAGAATDFVGYEKTDVLTAIAALEPDEDGRFLARLHESPFYAEGGGQVSDVGYIDHEETGARADLVRAVRAGEDQGRSRPGGRSLVTSLPHDGEPHGDPPPAQGAARRAGRPRPPGGIGRAARQAALRLHASTGPQLGRARGGGAPRQREGVREPAGARRHRPHRRGAQPGRDDAVRREVRRGRPRDRGTGLLARALRRHARACHRRDRPLRHPLRELGRLGCPAYRGSDRR